MSALEVCIVASLLLGLGFLWYVAVLVFVYLRATPDTPADPGVFTWHFLLPCRDEAAVIGETLDYLRSTFPQAVCWVVDDDSRDATASIVADIGQTDPAVRLVRRRMPHARSGKGDALNAGYRALCTELEAATDRESVIVCVVDADGRPSAGLLRVCAGSRLFGDATTGAAQVEVRMANRGESRPLPGRGTVTNLAAGLLARLQDIEFRCPISAMQMLRARSHTVNLGGNGQLVRLSALDALAGGAAAPWGNALLEDFEIGLRLMLAGLRIVYTTGAWVDQEGLWSLRTLLVQRTRWAQGSLQCLRYLPQIWKSANFTNSGLFEVTYFIVQPWLQVVGTVVYPVPLLVFIDNAVHFPAFTEAFLYNGGAAMLLLYLVIGVGEFAIWGFIYRQRCERHLSRRHALVIGLGMTAYAWLSYVIAWRAVARVVSGRTAWPKTPRNAELLRLQTLPGTSLAVGKSMASRLPE
ncbi:glycosyltransferase [Kitasatospora kifunensis]|uniref:Cellulose synthase/poly-beta-1,6-N-acetylglucosamine synthase-like glycosyltransferase n=1 Tax=Kitasatospora kifunensis TaxID=58351 RepID=A0A7W7W012_KITKI|nr:glycosyltransferase [Kitasatospora kifunensis]MBB4928185.1 cellulose synthase/poly-beta-1,6-N-acetylglucosamine synthase-like glycosyltransferase [Kitasatospora kifunensis]